MFIQYLWGVGYPGLSAHVVHVSVSFRSFGCFHLIGLGAPVVLPILFMFPWGRSRPQYVRCSLRPLGLRVSILIGGLVYW